jgi:integrase
MTAALADVGALPAANQEGGLPGAPERLERLVALLDPSFLEAIGWDAATQVLTLPPEHPQLGRRVCLVAGCGVGSNYRNGLCHACQRRYRSSGLDLEAFTAIRRVRVQVLTRSSSTLICAVAPCPRPVKSAPARLCATHATQRDTLGLALPVFLAHPQVRALPSFGDCRVVACAGPAGNRRGLCRVHDARWRWHRRHDPDLDLDRWCQTQPRPWIDTARVVLAGLPLLVQAELLYGLQERCRRDCKTKPELLRTLCELLRHARVGSVLAFSTSSQIPWSQHTSVRTLRRQACYVLAAAVQAAVRRAFSSPELERRKDSWDMSVFGHPGTLDFTRITQPWLHQAVMDWAAEEVPTRQGRNATVTLQATVKSLELLSASLRLQRADQGMDPAVVGRVDLVAFLNRLGQLHADGHLSSYQRCKTVREAARLLRDCRELGLTRSGRPLAGLADDFALRMGDIPQLPDRSQEGRALPAVVLEQLVAALPLLEQRSRRVFRVAVQLLIDTGRRPDEVCSLRWDCLEQDPHGKHALIYTDYKNRHLGRRLAITDQTAQLIGQQQQTVRAQFPDTPIGELALLPTTRRNPHGTRSITEGWLARLHRDWVDGLPELLVGREQRRAFDRAKVFLYAYRHSYAQRHADAGTPVDELRELMGHDSMTVTQTYYRVTAKRTRAAVDRLAALQFDGHGNRSWRQARALLEHEHQRLAIGQVAVPFGICTEPSNVQAGGHACPFRFRCVGCGHFRSDPSYLPELRSYLDLLLRNRERVRAAVELEEWARAEAMPSEEEISRVRALIRRVETDLEQLSDEERAQIDAACRVVRTTRQTVHLGMPTIGPPDPDPALEGSA